MGTIDKENSNIGDKRSGSDRRVSADPNYTGLEKRVNESRRSRIDKRKHKRFDVKDGAYSVLSYHPTVMGQVINMSMDGLAVTYKGKRLEESNEVDLFISDAGFYTDQIPVKTVSDHKLAGKFLFSSKTIWQRSLQFGDLTNDQKSQLKQFLQRYTSMIERSEKGRRQSHNLQYSGPERRSGIKRRS